MALKVPTHVAVVTGGTAQTVTVDGIFSGALRVYNDTGEDLTVTGVRASVDTAPTGATLIVDVNLAGTTIFTTQASRPAIAISPRRQ
jgi:hypothetical protein